jgi:hypothetical protein
LLIVAAVRFCFCLCVCVSVNVIVSVIVNVTGAVFANVEQLFAQVSGAAVDDGGGGARTRSHASLCARFIARATRVTSQQTSLRNMNEK